MNLHGIIFADRLAPELKELTLPRTAASLPYAGRYRLIDFPLSAMQNAGVHDVDVIMQRDFQSLLDHVGSGKTWDMSRRRGGLRLLPPFDSADTERGGQGTMGILLSIKNYIRDIRQDYVVLCSGTLAANLDLSAVMQSHLDTGASVTAVCTNVIPPGSPAKRLIADENNYVTEIPHGVSDIGLASLEVFLMSQQTLIRAMEICSEAGCSCSHYFALRALIEEGCAISAFIHEGYAKQIRTVSDYYTSSMALLGSDVRRELFTSERPVNTKVRSDVGAYYGDSGKVSNCLIADGCRVEGEVKNCLLFRGVVVERGAYLENCIIMQDSVVGAGARLAHVISDKDTQILGGTSLLGSPEEPIIIPKAAVV